MQDTENLKPPILYKWQNQRGFTLIEMSLVILIIGLIVGGFFSATTLVRQYQLRATLKQMREFQTAHMTFRLKYNYLPGDIPNATNFFGTNPDCSGGTAGDGTCNGNGNDKIELIGPLQVPPREQFYAWNHLALAGLIGGNYTGISVNYAGCVAWSNCPGGPLSGAQAYYIATGTPNPTTSYWPYHEATFITIGAIHPTIADRYPLLPILTSNEALGLDVKADDGKPGLGFWQVFSPLTTGYSAYCAKNEDGTDITDASVSQNIAVYNSDASDALRCSMVVYLD